MDWNWNTEGLSQLRHHYRSIHGAFGGLRFTIDFFIKKLIVCYRFPVSTAISTDNVFSKDDNSKSGAESRPEGVHAVQRKDAQRDGDRLLEANGAGDGGTTEHDGSEEAELNAVGLVVLDAISAEGICYQSC